MNPGPPQIRIVRPASPAPLPGDDDDHFVPPEPPPLPRLDPITKGAWVALFGGPAYLLIAVVLSWQVPSLAAFAAVAAFVGGFATLVVRMGDRPPRDSGPDDGAVV
jgi:membrane associated rhomboid family serine protease